MPRGVGLLEKSFCLVETILFSLHSLLLSTRLVWCYISSRLLLFFARASWRTHFALKKKGRKTKRKKNLPLSMGAALALECSLWPLLLLLLALTEQRARFINYRSRVTFFPSSSNSTPEAAGAIRTWKHSDKVRLGEGKGKRETALEHMHYCCATKSKLLKASVGPKISLSLPSTLFSFIY